MEDKTNLNKSNTIQFLNFKHNRIYNDIFRYNIDKDELEKLSPKNLPTPRNSHSSCYDISTNSIYIYGGANSEGPLNDLQVFNPKTNEFYEL